MDAVVGVGTILLALATFGLAWVAWRTLELQRTQTERAYRPVIVPAASTREVQFRGGTVSDAPAGPAWMDDGRLAVAVENVGMGPALNVRGIVETGGGGSSWGRGRTLHPIEGVGSGAANAVTFTVDDGTLAPKVEVFMRLAYEDVASETYWTDLHYNASHKGYTARVWGPVDVEQVSYLPSGRRLEDVLPLARFK
jgi:hypothetical protein